MLTTTSVFPIYQNPLCQASSSTTFYVGENYNSTTPGWDLDHFNKIQNAINRSENGYTIIVYNGTYSENLTLNKSINLFGEDRDITIIEGLRSSDTIRITVQHVNISHFNITYSGTNENDSVIRIEAGNTIITDNRIAHGQNGIYIDSCNNNIIYDNAINNNVRNGIKLYHSDSNEITYNIPIRENGNGILLSASDSNTITYNTIIGNSEHGIFLNSSSNSNNPISNNNLSSNTKNGVYLKNHCNYNVFATNNIFDNLDTGIRVENSSLNTLDSNIVKRSDNYGVMIVGSSNFIMDNTINYNSNHGIFLFSDDNNDIHDNTVNYNSYDGLRLYNSSNDTIYNNDIAHNNQHGIFLDFFTINNYIYNNKFYDNTDNGMDKSLGRNQWNMTPTYTASGNIIDGDYLGGNYWDDYIGDDGDSDGIGDTSYTIYASNTDDAPLVDMVNPVISSVQYNPSSTEIGSYTNISAQVTDNLIVESVKAIITYPSGQSRTHSMTSNKTLGDRYYMNRIFTPVGNYSFNINVSDGRNYANSSTYYFEIYEGTAPTIVDNSPSLGEPASWFTFNTTVTDDVDDASLLTVKVDWSHGSESGNHTMSNTNEDYFEASVYLDSSTDDILYTLWACDRWGNSVTSTQSSVSVTDLTPPDITINRYGSSFKEQPNSFTYNVTVTDETTIASVEIEYWVSGGTHITADMDNTIGNYYEKVIIPEDSPQQLFCVIYAEDANGNRNNTKNPIAKADGPYRGYVTEPIKFNGTGSFDLDGNLTGYLWDFGDGTTANEVSPSHAYSSYGNYTVSLTITDDDSQTDIDTSYAVVIKLIQVKTTQSTLQAINDVYDLSLTELFYSYDTNGDGEVDTFFDPNNVLVAVQPGSVEINGDSVFLISINDTVIPEFLWNADDDTITTVTYKTGQVTKTDEQQSTAKVTITVDKPSGWMYMQFPDEYPEASLLNISGADGDIALDRIWRVDTTIYLLDDPSQTYNIYYEEITVLENAVFSPDPKLGVTIGESVPTIMFTYNVPVHIYWADFYMPTNINMGEDAVQTNKLVSSDNMVFRYTPESNFASGTYVFEIKAEDEAGNVVFESVYFDFKTYATLVEEPSPLMANIQWILLAACTGAVAALIILFKKKGIKLEDFIYIKNKKILPFFRPLVLGPLSVKVDDNRISKAEFYVDGALKQTMTDPPYRWQWDERTFMKHTVETKIYDAEGNSSSSGKMPFYVFNPFSNNPSKEEVEQ